MKKELSEYYDERDTQIDMLVLHCSAQTGTEMLKVLNELKLSVHYILDENGELIQCVPEEKRAWHAGKGYWRGSEASLNSRSIGIEISSPSLGQEAYSEAQINKLIPFCKKIIRKYGIPSQNVVGHSDVAPLRKPDPGVGFPWKRLAKEGVGLWYQPRNAAKTEINDIAKLLAEIGYDTRDEKALEASAYAFCRHFLPQYVQKDADVYHLLENILPDNFNFMQEPKFVETLKAVAWSYQ